MALLKGDNWLGGNPVLTPVQAQLALAVVHAVAEGEGAQINPHHLIFNTT